MIVMTPSGTNLTWQFRKVVQKNQEALKQRREAEGEARVIEFMSLLRKKDIEGAKAVFPRFNYSSQN